MRMLGLWFVAGEYLTRCVHGQVVSDGAAFLARHAICRLF